MDVVGVMAAYAASQFGLFAVFWYFVVLALLSVKITVFWDVTPCSLLSECYTTRHLIPEDHFNDFRPRIGRILQRAGDFLSPKLIMIPGKSVFMRLPVSNVSHNFEKENISFCPYVRQAQFLRQGTSNNK